MRPVADPPSGESKRAAEAAFRFEQMAEADLLRPALMMVLERAVNGVDHTTPDKTE